MAEFFVQYLRKYSDLEATKQIFLCRGMILLSMSKSENRQLSPWATILAHISDRRNMVGFLVDGHILPRGNAQKKLHDSRQKANLAYDLAARSIQTHISTLLDMSKPFPR